MNALQTELLTGFDPRLSDDEMLGRARSFYETILRRRSVRHFSRQSVPSEVICSCIQAAGRAPSGANQQPWHFVAVSNPDVKRKIRLAAEREEHEFYHGRAPDEWLRALAPIGTDEHKPFLEKAPWLIAIFAQSYQTDTESQATSKNYYVVESVGIATGMLITALNHVGLATLTHTPSPMRFLNEILQRPQNERPFLLLVVGFPEADCQVPKLSKKSLPEISTFVT